MELSILLVLASSNFKEIEMVAYLKITNVAYKVLNELRRYLRQVYTAEEI